MTTTPTSLWEQHNVTNLIRQILASVAPGPQDGVGRPFMTTYQIAIEFEQRFPNVVTALGHTAGGQGQGYRALTNYIARWLPDRIVNRGVTDIEFRFLSALHMTNLEFDNGGNPVTATTNQAGFDATMFRLVGDTAQDTGATSAL
jgi:hypothetical protein